MSDINAPSHTGDSGFAAIRTGKSSSLKPPYARPSESSHSGSVWEDVRSTNAGDLDDTLQMIADELNERRYPTTTSVIMGDSPGEIRPTSATPSPATGSQPTNPRMSPTLMNIHLPEQLTEKDTQIIVDAVMNLEQQVCDPTSATPPHSDVEMRHATNHIPAVSEAQVIGNRLDQIQTRVERKLNDLSAQLKDGEEKQNRIVAASDTLVDSLRDALSALQLSQTKHESMMQDKRIPTEFLTTSES